MEGVKEITKSIDHNNSIESVGIGFDHSNTLESVGVNISNSLIAGVSVLTIGIIFSSFLSGVNNLHVGHTSQKYGKEWLKQVDKSADLTNSIKEENKFISHYLEVYYITFGFGIGIVSIAFFRARINK
jgi:high-affinity nickel permease